MRISSKKKKKKCLSLSPASSRDEMRLVSSFSFPHVSVSRVEFELLPPPSYHCFFSWLCDPQAYRTNSFSYSCLCVFTPSTASFSYSVLSLHTLFFFPQSYSAESFPLETVRGRLVLYPSLCSLHVCVSLGVEGQEKAFPRHSESVR